LAEKNRKRQGDGACFNWFRRAVLGSLTPVVQFLVLLQTTDAHICALEGIAFQVYDIVKADAADAGGVLN
jgi:hypothetical protein